MNSAKFNNKPIYSVLANIYDTLMGDVDYNIWATYLDEVIQKHAPEAHHVLELACGTGTLSLLLDELNIYRITATDFSPEMIEKAREKATLEASGVNFKVMDFLDIKAEKKYDLVFMSFDSLNYLHHESEVLEMHRQVTTVLNPGGFFIYDFTTPRNSRKAIEYLHNEEGISPNHYRYFRTSDFDPVNNIHTNEFEIEKLDANKKIVEQRFVEVHRQKIYTLNDILDMVAKTNFNIRASYDGFNFNKADNKSLRITMVLQWQKTR